MDGPFYQVLALLHLEYSEAPEMFVALDSMSPFAVHNPQILESFLASAHNAIAIENLTNP